MSEINDDAQHDEHAEANQHDSSDGGGGVRRLKGESKREIAKADLVRYFSMLHLHAAFERAVREPASTSQERRLPLQASDIPLARLVLEAAATAQRVGIAAFLYRFVAQVVIVLAPHGDGCDNGSGRKSSCFRVQELFAVNRGSPRQNS